MDTGLDIVTLHLSREEARMVLTAIALRHYVANAYDVEGNLDQATLTHYRHLGHKIRLQVDQQLGGPR